MLIAILLGVLVGIADPSFGAALDQAARRRLHQADQDGDRADHLLHRRVRHRRHVEDAKKVGRVGVKALLYFEVVSTFALVHRPDRRQRAAAGRGLRAGHARRRCGRHLRQRRRRRRRRSTSSSTSFPDTRRRRVRPAATSCRCCCSRCCSASRCMALGERGDAVRELHRRHRARPVRRHRASSCRPRRSARSARWPSRSANTARRAARQPARADRAPSISRRRCSSFVVLGLIARWSGFSIFRFLRYIKDELLIVLGTSLVRKRAAAADGEAREARLLASSVVGLVVPTGYSFNLDGTKIYMTLATLFIAQALDIRSRPRRSSSRILVVAMLTSKGAAASPARASSRSRRRSPSVDPRARAGHGARSSASTAS